MIQDTQLQYESRIVWLVPLDRLPKYVRQSVQALPRRRGLSWQKRHFLLPGRIVGYSELRPDAPSDAPGEFVRRVFWLKSHDPYGGGGAPAESVDPRTVRIGFAAVSTTE